MLAQVSRLRLAIELYPAYLNEADILALLPETLTADVEAIFADETGCVCADTTVESMINS